MGRSSAQPATLRDLIEGTEAVPPGAVLDVGCGTGDSSIYLAQHGWQVTGVDFTPKALDTSARQGQRRTTLRSISSTPTSPTCVRPDISGPFQLIVDNGCFHGMSDGDRDLYVHEISAAAAPGARLLMVAFKPSGRFGPAGVDQAEIERRFAPTWTLLSAVDEPQWTGAERFAARFTARSYVLQRNG